MSDQEKKWTQRGIVIGIFIFIGLLLIFKAGMMIGAYKSAFSYRYNEQYPQDRRIGNYGMMNSGMMRGFDDRNVINASSTIGIITNIEGSKITVQDNTGVEKILVITNNTAIRRHMNSLSITDLHVSDSIIAFGQPNKDGEIEATLIRATTQGQTTTAPQQPNPEKK